MPKVINYTLSNEELKQIEDVIKTHPDAKARQRAQAIRYLHLGYKPKEVADLLLITQTSVYNIHTRWRETKLDSLVDRPRSGRPKRGGDEYDQQLEALLETDPQTLGYGFTVWNVERLLDHLEIQTGIRPHSNTLLNRLKRLGYVFRRPKHDLTNLQDPKAKETAAETLQELKKKPKRKKSNYSLWTKQQSA